MMKLNLTFENQTTVNKFSGAIKNGLVRLSGARRYQRVSGRLFDFDSSCFFVIQTGRVAQV